MRQLLLDLLPESTPTLANFIPGANEEALSAFSYWLAAPEGEESAFLFWGDPGSGKSHLLQASGFFYLDIKQDRACANLPETASHLAVDHVELLAETGQIALFHAFNQIHARRGKLLVAAAAPPAQLILREDLRTRLGSGLVYRLNTLSDAEKKTALAGIAATRSLPLGDDGLDYLLSHASRDMRILAATMAALDCYSLEQKRPLTVPFLRAMLGNPLRESCLEP
ncbi:MAG: DnaA regulatory inactivator Hda [Betaproteobacteria bacterium]|nr:DnaA regulatory inactivator Hda [Betaproteobacteria bacterium]